MVGGPYCLHCGALTTRSDDRRRRSFAVQSGEGVFQLAVVTTVMPHANGRTANRYRWALGLGALVVVVTTLAGLLPAAVFSGALVVPVTYALYLYDHGIGGEAPGSAWVAVLLTAALSVLVSLVFFRWVFDDQFTRLVGSPRRAGLGTLPVGPFLVFVLLLPLVAQIAMNAGAAWLVTRPRLDDMLDGLAFGVMAGTVYAGGESIVAYWSVFTAAQLRTTQGLGTWLPVILGVMVVKAFVYGLATGLTVAAFSGRNEGWQGFGRRHGLAFATALGALVAYWAGIRLLSYVDNGAWLGLLWGVVVLVALTAYARATLHAALLETALEEVAAHRTSSAAVTGVGTCPECSMALPDGALFCVACGQSVRATSARARRDLRTAAAGDIA